MSEANTDYLALTLRERTTTWPLIIHFDFATIHCNLWILENKTVAATDETLDHKKPELSKELERVVQEDI